jgi:hypothetical protein
MIANNEPVRLYLDCEFDLPDDVEPLNHSAAIKVIDFLVEHVLAHLRLSFPHIEHLDDLVILQACTPRTFSVHTVRRRIVFDNAACSCAAYVNEFSACFKNHRFDYANLAEKINNMIDLSVYKKKKPKTENTRH